MAKQADKEKEAKFIDYFTSGETQGNATQSCIKAGWKKETNPAQMGAYLRKKLGNEIRIRQEDRISGTTGRAISVLQDLLESEQDAVRLNTCKFILEMGNFNQQTINLNVDNIGNKTDEELMKELKELVGEMPAVSKIVSQHEKNAPDLANTDILIDEAPIKTKTH